MAEWRSQYCTTDNQYILFRIWVRETATNVINNTSTLRISVYAWRTNEYTTNYGGGCNVKIDGTARGYQYWNWGEKPVYYDSDTFLYDEEGIVVSHNSDGTKTINVAATCEWYADGSIYIDSAWQSFNVTLTALDRSAPTVSVSTSNIGVNSFTISASSNVNCDRWDRSIDNGSTWTNFSTTNGTSASTTVTGLSPNTTYNVKVRARKTSNQVYGASATTSPKTIGNSILNSVSTVTADNSTVSFTINTTVYVPSYTHKLEIKNGNTSILTKTGLTLSSGNNTITLTSAERTTLLNAMSTIKSFTGTFNLSTWSGSTQIGSTTSKTATVQTTSANSAPTFSSFTYSDTNTTTTGITGNNQILIQGYSTLQVVASAATAKNGATIKSYSVSAGSATAYSTSTTINVGTVSNTGTVAVTVSAVDSRGYSTSKSVNVTVLAYTKIKFTSSTIRRVNEVENTIQLSFAGTITSLSVGGTDKNALQACQYRYKKTSDSSYGSYTNIVSSVTRSGNNLSYSNNSLVNLDANYSWHVQVYLQDKLTTDTITLTVGQGTPTVSFRNKKVGINVLNPAYNLDVGGTFAVSGDIYHKGSKSTTNTIHFIDNTADAYGNGIRIGGGGCTIIGGGESASTAESGLGYTGGSEAMVIANDSNIEFYSNLQDGWANRKTMNFKSNGFLTINGAFITNFSGSGSYNEGIRINKGSNNWATLHIGGTGESGTGAGQWGIFVNHTSYPRRLMIGHGSSSTNTYFSARSDSQTSPDLVCGNTTIYGTGSNGGLNSILVGDDCYLGDCNVGGHLGLKAAASDSCGIKCYNNGGTLRGGITFNNGTVDIYFNGTQHRMGCTTVYSGTLKANTQATWANVDSYSCYLIIGDLNGTGSPLNSLIVSRSAIGTSNQRWQYADESAYYSFLLWYSGTTGYIKGYSGTSSNAYVKWVIGLN